MKKYEHGENNVELGGCSHITHCHFGDIHNYTKTAAWIAQSCIAMQKCNVLEAWKLFVNIPSRDNNVVNQFVLTRLLVCDELIQNLHDQE